MPSMRGTITLVQESRFQLTDLNGVSHLFTLAPGAAAEPAQLAPLAARQAEVQVRYAEGDNIIGYVAEDVFLDRAAGA